MTQHQKQSLIHPENNFKKTFIYISVMLSGQEHGHIIHLNLCPQTLQNMNVRELSSNVGWMRFCIYWPQVKPVPRSPQIATITTLPILHSKPHFKMHPTKYSPLCVMCTVDIHRNLYKMNSYICIYAYNGYSR